MSFPYLKESRFEKKFNLMLSALFLAAAFITPAKGIAHEHGLTTSTVSAFDSKYNKNLVGNNAAPVPASTVTDATDLDVAMATLSQYLVYQKDGQRRFDTTRAEADNASEYLLEAGADFNRLAANKNEPSNMIKARGMPGYGNWCGPGHSGPGAPINTIDRLCQKHDKCYATRGYFACSCDKELVQDIRDNRGNFKGAGENAMVLAIATYFNSALCNPFK